MAGYSGTPLPKKLGFKPGTRACFVNEPQGLSAELGPLEGVAQVSPRSKNLDLVLLFCKRLDELEAHFAKFARQLNPSGMIWVAWPKRSSGVATDLDENFVRAHGLACGLVDVKVCAITDVWSGLKFVIRLRDRG